MYVLFAALEGYLLYRALVVVFDTGDHRNFPLYIFGYGLPIVVTTVTFIVALLASENIHQVCCKNALSFWKRIIIWKLFGNSWSWCFIYFCKCFDDTISFFDLNSNYVFWNVLHSKIHVLIFLNTAVIKKNAFFLTRMITAVARATARKIFVG